MSITKEKLERIRTENSELIQRLESGENCIAICTETYCKLPGKTETDGASMAQDAFNAVENYYDSKKAAEEDLVTWVSEQVSKMTVGMNPTAAYNKIYQFYVNVVATGQINSAKTEEEKQRIIEELKDAAQKEFTDEQITSTSMEELLENLTGALIDVGITDNQLICIQEQLENAEINTGTLFNFAEPNKEQLTVLAMQAYVDLKMGQYPDLPATTTLEEITYHICAADDSYRIAQQVAQGYITEEEGNTLLGFVGAVLFTLLAACVAWNAALWLVALIGGVFAPALNVIFLIASSYLIFEYIEEPYAKTGKEIGNKIQHFTVKMVKKIVNSVKNLIELVKAKENDRIERNNARCKQIIEDTIELNQKVTPVELNEKNTVLA